jgi:hypothetical protein
MKLVLFTALTPLTQGVLPKSKQIHNFKSNFEPNQGINHDTWEAVGIRNSYLCFTKHFLTFILININ